VRSGPLFSIAAYILRRTAGLVVNTAGESQRAEDRPLHRRQPGAAQANRHVHRAGQCHRRHGRGARRWTAEGEV